MKKMNVFITAFTLVITSVAPMVSSAATSVTEESKDVTLSKKYDSHYTLKLPDKGIDVEQSSVNTEVGVNAYLEYGEKLTISVSSTNNWKLKDTVYKDNPTEIGYKLKVGENDLTEQKVSEVMSVSYTDNNNPMTTTMTFCDFEKPNYAGTYADTLTFSVTVGSASEKNEGTGDADQNPAPTEAATGNES